MAELPCLDLLGATPQILRGLTAGLADDDVRWKPAPDRFSIGEVLVHLAHSDWHCYRTRVDQFMSEERPELEPDEASFHLELYRKTDPKGALDHFAEQRQSNIEYLACLKFAKTDEDRKACARTDCSQPSCQQSGDYGLCSSDYRVCFQSCGGTIGVIER